MQVQPRKSWAEYSREVEADDQRKEEALRKFLHRERQPRPLTQSQRAALGLAWFIVKVLLASAVGGAFVWGAFHLPG